MNIFEQDTIENLIDLETVFKYEIETYDEFQYTNLREISYNFEPEQTLIGFQIESEKEDTELLNKILKRFIKKYNVSSYEIHIVTKSFSVSTWCLFTLDKDWFSGC